MRRGWGGASEGVRGGCFFEVTEKGGEGIFVCKVRGGDTDVEDGEDEVEESLKLLSLPLALRAHPVESI